MNAGSQPLGTGTTFFKMNDFVTPKSQQTPVAAPAPAPVATPTPAAPAPAPPAQQQMPQYFDWMRNQLAQPGGMAALAKFNRANPGRDGNRNAQRRGPISVDSYQNAMIKQLMGGQNGS